ncbi:MAG: class I SAM-dependent DNA methyltransferase [Flavobacteriales bacterium]
MDAFEETRISWNKVAVLYQEKFFDLKLYRNGYDRFCELLIGDDKKVLDVGSGPGVIARYLLDKNPELAVTGIDYATGMVELAKRNCPEADFLEMDVRQISKLGERYTGIAAGFIVPYLSREELQSFFRDCFNLLNSDGVFYFSFVESEEEWSGFITGSTDLRVYFYYYPTILIEKFLADAGFKNIEWEKCIYEKPGGKTEVHATVVCKRP